MTITAAPLPQRQERTRGAGKKQAVKTEAAAAAVAEAAEAAGAAGGGGEGGEGGAASARSEQVRLENGELREENRAKKEEVEVRRAQGARSVASCVL